MTEATDPAVEIASIEQTMRENRSAYDHDEGMQERYRALVGAGAPRGPVVVPPEVQAVENEIVTIEGYMQTNRRGYDRNEPLQQRLRDLYTRRAT